MASTLLISGALAQGAVIKFLRSSQAVGCIVVEFDTLLEKEAFPHVAHWFNSAEFITSDTSALIDQQARELLCFYLKARPEIEDRIEDVELRKACLKTRDQQIVVPFMANKYLADALFKRFSIDQILVAPGCGVNLPCWRSISKRYGIPIKILTKEKPPLNLERRIQKLLSRTRKKKIQSTTTVVSPHLVATLEPLVICASERVSRLLHSEAEALPFKVRHVSMKDLGEVRVAESATEAQHFRQWWCQWQKSVFTEVTTDAQMALEHEFFEVLQTLGNSYIDEIYPRYSILKKRALAYLSHAKPDALLCDTQTDNVERVWSLAASELNIPVIAYTYDHLVDPKLTFIPDYLLTDGIKTTLAATRKGYPRERIVETRSHRRPSFARRSDAELQAAFNAAKPTIIFADSYYTSFSASADPQSSLIYYKQIVSVARRLPQMQFFIKFHPLRAGKSELLSFAGMDEHELYVKRRFIKSLKPPKNLSLLDPEVNMIQTLTSASVLVNTYSTSGHEAFHLGVPVVFLRNPDSNSISFANLDQFMKILYAPDEATLSNFLIQLTTDEEMRQRQILDQQRYVDDFYWKSNLSLGKALRDLFAMPMSKI